MKLLGDRIRLNPRPVQSSTRALDVAMLGHCPGQVRIDRLLNLSDALDETRAAGFGSRIDKLLANAQSGNQGSNDASLLDHLPIPLHSIAEFNDIFPDAHREKTQYRSLIAGNQAWLPQAVSDFFANGGDKLWIIKIPESEGQQGFLPRPGTVLHDSETLFGLALTLVLNNVGLLALPDLERLQLSPTTTGPSRLRLENPDPTFLPCTQGYNDGHRERRHSSELDEQPQTWPLMDLLRPTLSLIRQHRPDIQILYTLPLLANTNGDKLGVDPASIEKLNELGEQAQGQALRNIQFLFPYLRSANNPLISPCGALAGLQNRSARQRGVWRSTAGMALLSDGRPYPQLTQQQVIQLRERPGLGIIMQRGQQVVLDDERLTVPVLHSSDYLPSPQPNRWSGYRSGEVARFMGFLQRRLRALGESLVFNSDPRDPAPKIVLERFFTQLFEQGALRGSLPEHAFSIRSTSSQENSIAFDIEIAPAFPIDRISLTFINRDGNWRTELGHE